MADGCEHDWGPGPDVVFPDGSRLPSKQCSKCHTVIY